MENLEKLKNKNFLIVGSGFQLSIEKSYIRAFRKLGFKKLDYLFLDQGYLSILNKFNYSKISKTYYLICRIILINFLKKKKFHYIIIFKGIQFDLNTLEKSRKIQDSAKWINIYTDNPFNMKSRACSNLEVLNSIKFYDYFCLPFYKTLNKKLKKLKAKKIVFLPFGYDKLLQKIYRTNKIKKNKKINFIGTHDKYRENLLKSTNLNIDVYGPGWSKVIHKNKLNIFPEILYGLKLSKIINKYSISLNILRKQDKKSHNMKTFEIPAMGGLMLTSRSSEQNIFFRENKECYMYKDYKELKNKVKLILSKLKKSNFIRRNGVLRSKKYTYENRLKSLLVQLK